jgi:hypothetical protein
MYTKTKRLPNMTRNSDAWDPSSGVRRKRNFLTEILERFQSKALRIRGDAPCYVPNTVISKHKQLKKKSAATALNTVFASVHNQTA